MPRTAWRFLSWAPNVPSAQALVSLLRSQGIAGQVVTDTVLLGQFQECRVFVAAAQLHQAQRLLAQDSFSDAELSSLAAGDLPSKEPEE
jgi:hypothetical protein